MDQNPFFDYDALVEAALRNVVRTALTSAAKQGLHGEHHFYITFRTDAEGVIIPKRLLATNPEDLTIVIQHEYWDLTVNEDIEDGFAVSLSFNDIRERLLVPFNAITGFADPSAKFGLQFQYGDDLEDSFDDDLLDSIPMGENSDIFSAKPKQDAIIDEDEDESGSGSSKVVVLDAFRKK